MTDILLTVIPIVAVSLFFALPAAVALMRRKTSSPAGEGTIPQQRNRRVGGDA